MKRWLMFILIVAILSSLVQASVSYTRTSKTICNMVGVDKICTKTLYSGPMFGLNSDNEWVDASDLLRITKNSDDITFHYDGVLGYKNITFEVGVIHNSNYYSMATVKGNYPQINFKFPTQTFLAYKKYSMNITDIPVALQPGLEYVTLTYKDHAGFDIGNLKKSGRLYKIKNVLKLSFYDLLDSNRNLSINVNEKRIRIGNLSIVNNELFLDPSLSLTGTNENLGDTDVQEDSPDTNTGSEGFMSVQNSSGFTHHGYIKWNVSSILSGSDITDASLGLHVLQANEGTNYIFVNRLFNYYNWSESTVTWNTKAAVYGQWNITPEGNLTVDAASVWKVWNVTNSIEQCYGQGESNCSLIIHARNGNNIRFDTKEWAEPPYLNITYIDNQVPTYSGFQNNGTNAKINDIINFSVTIADNYNLSTWIFAHNQSGTMTNQTEQQTSGTSVPISWNFTVTKTRGVQVCGKFWFNDTKGLTNHTNTSCFSVSNSPLTLDTNLQFTNYYEHHMFNVTAKFSDLDTFADIASLTITTVNGSCTHLSNTTSGNDLTALYNCSGTPLESTYVQINATDGGGVTVNTSRLLHTVPNNVPTVTEANVTPSSPADGDDLTCVNGTVSDADSDTVTLQYLWYNNSVQTDVTEQVLGNGNTTVGEKWKCVIIPNDGYQNGSSVTSGEVSIGTSLRAPIINNTNATTAHTKLISNATNPSNNNSWINFSVMFHDNNTGELHTIYFCDTDNANISGCGGTAYCNSTSNVTAYPTFTCAYNLTTTDKHLYDYYVFVYDNASLASSSKQGTFEVNYRPSIPAVLQPLNKTNHSTSYVYLNFSSTDYNNDTINYSIYGGTSLGAMSLLNNSINSYYNWTSLTDGTHYITASTEDIHLYSYNQNKSTTQFLVDTTGPNVNASRISSTSIYTTASLTFYVNATDNLSAMAATYCEFELLKSDYNGGNGVGNLFNLTSNTKNNNTFSVITTVAAMGTGTLEWRKVFCKDSLNNWGTNGSVNINITISTETGAGGGGGGASITKVIQANVSITDIEGVCGNGICELGEDPYRCFKDCGADILNLEKIFCTPFLKCGNWLTSWFSILVGIALVIFVVFVRAKGGKS